MIGDAALPFGREAMSKCERFVHSRRTRGDTTRHHKVAVNPVPVTLAIVELDGLSYGFTVEIYEGVEHSDEEGA